MRCGQPFAIAALVFVTCGCEAETERLPRDSSWEPHFFESIREKERRSGLTPLREAALPEGSSEIRVWAGFGLQWARTGGHPLEGIVLERHGERFSGAHYPRAPESKRILPASGWARFWRKLEAAGVFDLPDSSELKGYDRGIFDGISYVVELRRGAEYRTYKYGNPELQDLPEAKRFLRLLELLRTETGFDSGR